MVKYLRPLTIALLALLGGLSTQPAPAEAKPNVAVAAHAPGQSYIFLRVYDDSLVVRFEILAKDLAEALDLDWVTDGGLESVEVSPFVDSVRTYVEDKFGLVVAGAPLPLRYVDWDVRFVDWGDFITLTYAAEDLSGTPEEIEITFSTFFERNSDHRNVVVIEHNWQTGTFNNEANISLIMSPRSPTQTLDLTSSTVWRGFLAMIWQGVWHILIGIDHILFLIALVLPSVLVREEGKWQPAASFRIAAFKLLGIVTCFTIAHSITLSMAALELVRFPSRIVESIIAGSIAVAAAANLMPKLNIKEWAIAFAFGLFHGFGFATVLGDIGLGRDFLVLTLLGFNVGVELGQIAIIAVVFPILFFLRDTKIYGWLFRVGSILLILVAMLWVFERVFDFNIALIRMARGLLGL